jgi:glycosyltransferase involved in cell wall biosynthesis
MPSISLIVATYNWPDALNVCLLSIKQQTLLPNEVIVADDGSNDATKALIDEMQQDFPVPLIHVWQTDLGFRKSLILNKAIAKATSAYIVQVDGDVILDKHFIYDHASVAENGFFIRGTRAHISRAYVDKVLRENKIDFNYGSLGLVHRFNALRLPALAFLMEQKSSKSSGVRGSNFAFWKSDFLAVNGYDNDLTGWGHEDEELAIRLINNNVLRKSVKFKCVQFHLYHPECSHERKPLHVIAVNNTRKQNLKSSKNGIVNINQEL